MMLLEICSNRYKCSWHECRNCMTRTIVFEATVGVVRQAPAVFLVGFLRVFIEDPRSEKRGVGSASTRPPILRAAIALTAKPYPRLGPLGRRNGASCAYKAWRCIQPGSISIPSLTPLCGGMPDTTTPPASSRFVLSTAGRTLHDTTSSKRRIRSKSCCLSRGRFVRDSGQTAPYTRLRRSYFFRRHALRFVRDLAPL